MNEKFCLKWNDFTSNTSTAFGVLRNEDFLQDVTLVGDDSCQIAAHKLVLSSCSEYFKNIFKSNKHSHPLLFLEGLQSGEIRNILDYIYIGEVKIFQEDVDKFLAIGQRFKLKGLLGDVQNDDPKDSTPQYKPVPPTVEPKDAFEIPIQKFHSSAVLATTDHEGQKLSFTEDDQWNLNEKLNQLLEKTGDGRFQCTLCGKSFKTKQQCQFHIEGLHLEGFSVACHLCGKIFRSRNSLSSHKTTKHKPGLDI